MKKVIVILFSLFSNLIFGQKIFSTKDAYSADVIVVVVKNEYQADLKVFKSKNKYQTSQNKGIWDFDENKFKADKKIYFTDKEYQASLKIFFVKNEFQAGWNNRSKIHLMY